MFRFIRRKVISNSFLLVQARFNVAFLEAVSVSVCFDLKAICTATSGRVHNIFLYTRLAVVAMFDQPLVDDLYYLYIFVV